MSRGLKTNREALQVLRNEGSWFGEKWRNLAQAKEGSGSGSDILPSSGSRDKLIASVQSVDPCGRVVMVAPDVGLREFCFDAAFPLGFSQESLYNATAKRQVG